MKPSRLAAFVAAALLSAPAAAAAQPADAPQRDDDGPVTVGRSGEATLARSLFDAGRWADAAPALERVARGETGDAPLDRQIARFYLGVALHHLGLYDAGLRVFAVIADAPSQYGFRAALGWLAALDAVLPEPAGVAAHVGAYLGEALEPARPDLRARIHRLLGWNAYDARSYERAILALEQVERESALYPRSQFMIGVSYVQLRRSVPAVRAFGRVVEAVGEETPGEDAEHLRNLAWISMARVQYSATVHLDDDGVPTVDMSKNTSSAKYWAKVEVDSELWPDAQLESSWYQVFAGNYPRALGNLHNFESGYFAASLFPEADVIRGIVAFTVCQYDDVLTIVARMRQRYLPIRRELSALLGRLDAGRDEDVVSFYREVRAGRAVVPAIVRPIVDTVIADRPIRKNLDYLGFIEREEARLQALSAGFRITALGEEVEAGLALARSAALHNIAARVRQLYQRRLDALDAHLLDAQKLVLDTAAARARPPAQWVSEERVTFGVPAPDVEHVNWPFDGEFWRDELGSYRQVVVSRCRR